MVIRDPWIRALVIVMLLIAGLYLVGLIWQAVSQFADIILLFFLAWIIAFILEPVVVFLQLRARFPRPLAVTIAYLGMLVLLTGVIVWLIPPLSGQVVQVASELPGYTAQANEQVMALQSALEERGIFVNLATLLQYEDLARRLEPALAPIVSNAVSVAASIATFLFQLAIVLILSFYVMMDGDRISRSLVRAMPTGFREDALFFFASVNAAFAGFLRGQLLQALIYSLGVAAIMYALGLNLILLTTVVNTIFMLIPFVGPALALVMPFAVTLIEEPSSFWLVVILVTVLQQIVLNVLAPRVMSSAIGLHPLLVFVGLLGGARVAGIWGALFGVPVVAVIAAMVSFYRDMLEQRRHKPVLPEPLEQEAPATEPSTMTAATARPSPPVGQPSSAVS